MEKCTTPHVSLCDLVGGGGREIPAIRVMLINLPTITDQYTPFRKAYVNKHENDALSKIKV